MRCRKSPFCRAIEQGNNAIVTGKAHAVLFCGGNNRLTRPTRPGSLFYVHNILVYYRGYLRYADFSHITLDTLALQCNGTNLK